MPSCVFSKVRTLTSERQRMQMNCWEVDTGGNVVLGSVPWYALSPEPDITRVQYVTRQIGVSTCGVPWAEWSEEADLAGLLLGLRNAAQHGKDVLRRPL